MRFAKAPAVAQFLVVFFLLSLMAPMLQSMDDGPVVFESESNISQTSGRAGSPDIFLAAGGGSAGNEFGDSISASNMGYYVAGDFNRSMNFGSHQISATSPFSNGNEFYLASISNSGTWNYLTGADHSQGGVSFLMDTAVGMGGTAVVAGYMYGPVAFGQNIHSTAVLDGFIAVADVSGAWMWAHAFQTLANTSTDQSIPYAIAVDQMGDIYVAGTFSGETDFGGTIINVSNNEVFVAKLSGATGSLLWVVSGGGVGNQVVTDIEIDQAGSIHVSGITQTGLIFGNKGYSTVGTQDSFILKMDGNGGILALSGYGIVNNAVTISEIESDSNGDLYIGGSFEGTLAQGSWSITANQGQSDVFVAKVTGTSQWASTGGTNAADGLADMVINSKNEIMFSALIQGSFTAGSKAVTAGGTVDMVVGGLSTGGSWDWLLNSGSSDYVIPSSLAVNDSDMLAISGGFGSNSPPAQMNKGTTTINSLGGWDTFVWVTDPVFQKDADNDGVSDVNDNCPNTSNPAQGNTDGDSEGDACDSDDDNDGITDNSPDNCPRNGEFNWTSTQDFDNPANSSDWDRDGCKDSSEDDDMDNDGVDNNFDLCQRSSYSPPRPTWVSDAITDFDGDGCRDSDEDPDDDGDGFDDAEDDCPTTVGTSTLGETGCIDTDGDEWSDTFDDCPLQAGNSTLGGKNACPDSDGDGWSNDDDAFDMDPTQWADTDGDGYGDNTEGSNPDECPTQVGTSTLDRIGCLDSDGDGYSDPDEMWLLEDGADAFEDDLTQWSDFDEDGYGDNWANDTWTDRNPSWPGELRNDVVVQDACPTKEGDSWQNGTIGCPDADGDGWYDLHDAFPQDPTQWSDKDGDKFGDNASGVDADDCPDQNGTSMIDRKGCSDTDGDGVSDPSLEYSIADGADAFRDDPTQWADFDEDRYGDNPNGNEPDACPNAVRDGISSVDRYGCPDTDGDGISNPDSDWTLAQGADACETVRGNSTADRVGCLDTDGDGFSNADESWGISDGADAYPDDPTRWIKEASDEADSAEGTTAIIVGGAGLLIFLAVGFFFMRGRGGEGAEAEWAQQGPAVGMPDFSAQPAYAAQPVAQPNFQAQPVAQPAYATQPVAQPVALPDPAQEYYAKLISQGYPPADAMNYTKQYYPHFQN